MINNKKLLEDNPLLVYADEYFKFNEDRSGYRVKDEIDLFIQGFSLESVLNFAAWYKQKKAEEMKEMLETLRND